MLAKANRLHLAADIAQTRTTGKRFYGQYATCFIRLDETLTAPRFAFIVSKKMSKLAVHRNRTKRLLREAIHEQLASITQPIDVVILAKQDLYKVSLQEVIKDIQELMKKVVLAKN